MVKSAKPKIKNPKSFNPLLWGTIGYLFLFIFRPFEYKEWLGAYHIERIYMIGLIFVVTFWSGKSYKHHPIATALLVFFGVICFSVVIAYRPDEALDRVWEYFKLMVLFFVILLTVRGERDFRILIIAFLAITGIYIGKSLWEFLFHGRYHYAMGIKRLVGTDITYGDPNAFAGTIIYSLPFAWALWKTEQSSRIKKGLIFYGIMSMAAIALTGSRSGMVSFIFLSLILWVRGKKKVLGAVGLVFILIISWYAMPVDLQKRFETIYDDSINPSATASAQGRIEGFKMGIKLFELSPIWGWGVGCSPLVVRRILGYDYEVQLHNLYAQLLSELGIMGAISFLGLVFLLFRTQRRIAKRPVRSGPNNNLILRRRQTSSLRTGSKAPLSINPEQTPGFGPGRVEGLIFHASIACTNVAWLLLFEGLFGHNLYRYTWIWICAILVLAQQLSKKATGSRNLANGHLRPNR
jgi:O-antigen ligase